MGTAQIVVSLDSAIYNVQVLKVELLNAGLPAGIGNRHGLGEVSVVLVSVALLQSYLFRIYLLAD